MLLWTFWWIIVSLLLIMLIHYLYIYMKNTLTVPIVEDTATKNKQRYDDMLAPVQVENIEINTTIAANDNDDSMKDELQAFLNELKITGGAQDIGAQDIGAQDIGAQDIGAQDIGLAM
jgi:hypothetical protein